MVRRSQEVVHSSDRVAATAAWVPAPVVRKGPIVSYDFMAIANAEISQEVEPVLQHVVRTASTCAPVGIGTTLGRRRADGVLRSAFTGFQGKTMKMLEPRAGIPVSNSACHKRRRVNGLGRPTAGGGWSAVVALSFTVRPRNSPPEAKRRSMDGILGYVGRHEAGPILLQGLRQLEHFGYGSAGLATVTDSGRLHICKPTGRLPDLLAYLRRLPAVGHLGITHLRGVAGRSPDYDFTPQLSFDGKVAVVHEGVLENRTILKRQVEEDGIPFRSRTDAEVIAQLITCHLVDDLVAAACAVLPLLRGASALAVISSADPDCIIAAGLGRPLLLGRGAGCSFLAGEAAALVGLTEEIVPLPDQQLAVLTTEGWRILDPARLRVCRSVFQLS